MSDPVSALLFSVGVALVSWGAFHGERRRLALAFLVGATAAALVALLSRSTAGSGLAFGVGAVVGALFEGWGGRAGRSRGPRGPLGGGWSGGDRFGGGGGGAAGSW